MSYMYQEAARWRANANELLDAADNLHDQVARDAMLEMAEGYMRLADKLEGLAMDRLKPGAAEERKVDGAPARPSLAPHSGDARAN
jgi:hypothetical protein